MPTDNPTSGSDSANPGAIPQDLLNDPTLGPLLSDPSIQAMLMGTGTQSAQPVSLADALVGSAMDVSGRYGITGQRFTGGAGYGQEVEAHGVADLAELVFDSAARGVWCAAFGREQLQAGLQSRVFRG